MADQSALPGAELPKANGADIPSTNITEAGAEVPSTNEVEDLLDALKKQIDRNETLLDGLQVEVNAFHDAEDDDVESEDPATAEARKNLLEEERAKRRAQYFEEKKKRREHDLAGKRSPEATAASPTAFEDVDGEAAKRLPNTSSNSEAATGGDNNTTEPGKDTIEKQDAEGDDKLGDFAEDPEEKVDCGGSDTSVPSDMTLDTTKLRAALIAPEEQNQPACRCSIQ